LSNKLAHGLGEKAKEKLAKKKIDEALLKSDY